MRITAAFLMVTTLACSAPQARADEAERPLLSLPYAPSLDLGSMDRAVDPCGDFYRYSCAGWERANPIPADQSRWGVYSKLEHDNLRFLWGILEDAAAASERSAVQRQIGDYFAACMDTAAIDADGLRPVQEDLRRIAGLTSRPLIAAEIGRLHHEALGAFFFGSGTEQDAINASLMIAGVAAGGLGLPDRDDYLRTDAKSVGIRARYRAYVEQLLALGGTDAAQARTEAGAVLRLETQLARSSLTVVERRDPYKTYHLKSMRQLAAIVPAINWPAYFARQGAPGVTQVNVAQPRFFRTLQAQLAGAPLADLRGYLRFHLLDGAAPLLSAPLREAHFDFHSRALRGVQVQPPRWRTCTRAVDGQLGEALGQEFVRRTFASDTKARVQRMTDQVRAAMAEEIRSLDWMSDATKAEALRKLDAIRSKIGYPDSWLDYSAVQIRREDHFGNVLRAGQFEDARQWAKLGKPVDLNEWQMSPPTVNAYFSPQTNDINFPAGVLQPPLYDIRLDDAPNYGNTGQTIGHELTHAFDDEGRQFDARGNLRNWWTSADSKRFENRAECIRKQYAGFVVVDGIHVNSRLTSGEDIADLGGTLLAYIAWRRQTEGQALAERDGLTPEQRFFIGMAQSNCENVRPEDQRTRALTDPHSPAFARVNGVVANLPEFHKAFQCKPGQPMVQVPVCRIW